MSYHIGIDLGGTFVKFGAVGENGNVLKYSPIKRRQQSYDVYSRRNK